MARLFLNLSVLVQPLLQSRCVCFSFPQRTKLLFTLFQPGVQSPVLLQELGQLVLQSLRFPQTDLKQTFQSRNEQKSMRTKILIICFR